MNDDGGSTLILDSLTEELLAGIAQKISDIEDKIQVIASDMNQNKPTGKLDKAKVKPLKKKKRLLKARKNTLEKQYATRPRTLENRLI